MDWNLLDVRDFAKYFPYIISLPVLAHLSLQATLEYFWLNMADGTCVFIFASSLKLTKILVK